MRRISENAAPAYSPCESDCITCSSCFSGMRTQDA
eukprot:XP_001709424.1 Hypothetical protein GL50803_2707 [Giardia lamblia ATCC 50803]